MMIPQDLLDLVHSRGGWEALEDNEADVLYQAALSIPNGSQITEIGCELGRSSVLLASVAKQKGCELHFVDPWVCGGTPYAVEWMKGVHAIGHPFTLHCNASEDADLHRLIGLLYIDGDHTEEGITKDCERFLWRVMTGCFVAFHDYGRDSLPDVYKVVNRYMDPEHWELAYSARTMSIWRRR